MIDCVSISTNHLFSGNPIYQQHRLRHDSIVQRQAWRVPTVYDMEYDQYDNPAASYLIWRDDAGQARGASRLYPTDRPFMLQEIFPYLVSGVSMPKGHDVWEGSRFCVDAGLPPDLRKRIIQEIIIGYLEFGLDRGVSRIVGVMCPTYCRNIFLRNGWEIDWLGEVCKSSEGFRIVAGSLAVSKAVLQNVRQKTGIYENVLNYGKETWLAKAA